MGELRQFPYFRLLVGKFLYFQLCILYSSLEKNQPKYLFKHYRFLASQDRDGTFADIAAMIKGFPGFEWVIVNESLFYFMENEMLAKDLHKPTALPNIFEKVFKTSSLARIRREETTVTVFGGVDWPLIISLGRIITSCLNEMDLSLVFKNKVD